MIEKIIKQKEREGLQEDMNETNHENCYNEELPVNEGNRLNEEYFRQEGTERIYVRVAKKEITTLNRIIESYDNIGVVSTLNAQEGLVMIQLTPDTEGTIRAILNELSFVQQISKEKN